MDQGSTNERTPAPVASRRAFLRKGGESALLGVAFGAAPLRDVLKDFAMIEPVGPEVNPLGGYPNRGWEQVYRDLYTPDQTYHYMCGPNDTHGCLLKASVKNGVVIYADPSFAYNKVTDRYGNKMSHRWDPRACVSGLAYVRRTYSDRRLKGAYVRKGWKQWFDDGMPRDPDGRVDQKYLQRGKEDFVKVTHAEAAAMQAKAYMNIAETYTGEHGAEKLHNQGYDPDMIEAMHEAGTQVLKHRGGMPFNAPLRIGGFYRFANSLALLDKKIRGVPDDDTLAGRVWDSFSWHTDLPPGHTLVSGQQAMEFDLCTVENANLITLWGMNWIATKMPEAHWLTEAKLHGAKVVTVAPEYQSSTSKADDAFIIRPATDTALLLGLAHVIIRDRLYDEPFVKHHTDLPLLVRSDTFKLLQATDVFPGYTNASLTYTEVVPNDFKPGVAATESRHIVTEKVRNEWGDQVVWDTRTNAPKAINRDQTGSRFPAEVDPALEGEFTVTLTDGKQVKVRPVFDAVKQYVMDTATPADIEKVTWAPAASIEEFAKRIAANKTKTMFVTGMGPNHFFNNDNKDRAMFLVAALTNNIGNYGGTIGCFSGNSRLTTFSGVPQYHYEDPYNINLTPGTPATVHKHLKAESAHYWNYGDRPLRLGNKQFTGKTHMPTPTKSMYFANSNSLLGNAKGAHQMFVNVLPKIDLVATNEWYWTASCEYSDIVYGVDSWPERQLPDIFGSVSNPFLHVWPQVPITRVFDTLDDMEVLATIGKALAEETGDNRFVDYWRFVHDKNPGVYIQRIFDAGNTTKGYNFNEVHESCKQGTPTMMLFRTFPKINGWEQTQESVPWWTRSGRLEFYRDEPEFIAYGENLPVHREAIDGTKHEPGVIMARPHPYLNPLPPDTYGLDVNDLGTDVRQVRNVMRTPDEIAASAHPLTSQGFSHVMITPKYRHACHTMGASVDSEVLIFGPFGDFYRHDKRKPWVSEGYIDLHPDDAKAMGVNDGDYVYCDGDPSDRPFRGWQDKPEDYKVTRWLVRARVNPSIAQSVGRAWFHFHVATHGSVQGHETRPDGLARNPRTNYQSGYRYGSHQSVTRAWLRPTLMTDNITRKDVNGRMINKGFELDVYCTVGAPKEAFTKLTKAEDGGEDTTGVWYPAEQGFRPGHENEAMRNFLSGTYVTAGPPTSTTTTEKKGS